jgi:hypothetical protein
VRASGARLSRGRTRRRSGGSSSAWGECTLVGLVLAKIGWFALEGSRPCLRAQCDPHPPRSAFGFARSRSSLETCHRHVSFAARTAPRPRKGEGGRLTLIRCRICRHPSPLRGGGTTRSVVGGGLATVGARVRSRDAFCIRVLLQRPSSPHPSCTSPRGISEGWRAPGLMPGGQSAFGGTVRAPAAVSDRSAVALRFASRLAPPRTMEGAPSPASPARP